MHGSRQVMHRDFFGNGDYESLSLPSQSLDDVFDEFSIAAPYTYLFNYALQSVLATIAVTLIGIVIIFIVALTMRNMNRGNYNVMLYTKKKLYDFFKTKRKTEETLGSIDEEHVQKLERLIVITPAMYNSAMMLLTAAIIILVVFGWSARSKMEIEYKVQRLVYSLGVEVETQLK